MCAICLPDGTMSSCQYCSRLICFDEDGDDDVIARAAVTSYGDVACRQCASQMTQDDERASDEDPLSWLPPYGDEHL